MNRSNTVKVPDLRYDFGESQSKWGACTVFNWNFLVDLIQPPVQQIRVALNRRYVFEHISLV